MNNVDDVSSGVSGEIDFTGATNLAVIDTGLWVFVYLEIKND